MTRICDDCRKESYEEIPTHYYSHYSDYKCRGCYRKSRGWKWFSKPIGLSECSECNREDAPRIFGAILIPKRAGLSGDMRRICNKCGGERNLCNEELGKDPQEEGWLTLQGNISTSNKAKKLDCVHCKGREKLFKRMKEEARENSGINSVVGTFKPRIKWTHRYWKGVEMFESKAFPGFVHCHYCKSADLVELKTRQKKDKKARKRERKEAERQEKLLEEERAAALVAQEKLESEHRYFDARFGRKGTSLKDWEETYNEDSGIGGKSTRESRVPGLKRSGVHHLIVKAYTDGMIDMQALRKIRKITPPDDEEEFFEILKMVFSYEHHRALKAASLDSNEDFGISKFGWGKLNREWAGLLHFFSPVCMELISPGVVEEQTSAKRLVLQIEGLIQMNAQVAGIVNRAVLLPEHEFAVIIAMLGNEMGDEEQRLLRRFVEGSCDGSDVYNYIEEYGLGDPDLIGFLGRILDGEDVELVLEDAGLLNE